MAVANSSGAILAPVFHAPTRKKSFDAHRRACAKYERHNKRGFLMRAYRNMQSRVNGVQYLKRHLYEGKELLERAAFYEWSLGSAEFHRLFDEWTASGHERRLCPSVDRIDSRIGYVLSNMRWVQFTENCKNIQRKRVDVAMLG
jgi:hypothetical protein